MEHGERYKRAREYFDVVTGLWDSWADDAFVRDVENGPLLRSREAAHARPQRKIPNGARAAQHARPVQGWPLIVQAGASEAGRQLAAETAEVVFAAGGRWMSVNAFTPTSRAEWQRSAAIPTI